MKQELSSILQRIVTMVTDLSDDDVRKLLDDSYRIEIKLVRTRNKKESSSSDGNIDVAGMVSAIRGCSSREEVRSYLVSKVGKKKNLEQVARHLNIPILKNDKVDMLRNKIIEATVGARLSAKAIQDGLA